MSNNAYNLFEFKTAICENNERVQCNLFKIEFKYKQFKVFVNYETNSEEYLVVMRLNRVQSTDAIKQ